MAAVASEREDDEVLELVVFAASTGIRIAARRLVDARFPSIALSPDRQSVLVGDTKRLEAFDTATLEPVFVIPFDDEVLSVAWSTTGVIAVGTRNSIRLFTAATGAERLD